MSDKLQDSSLSTSSVTSSWLSPCNEYQDEVEVVRERSDPDLKSDDVLCNYGDKVILADFSDETDIPNDNKPNPQSNASLTQVRYFVNNRESMQMVQLELSSPISDAEESVQSDEHSADSSSVGPSKSYSSITDYLASLNKKKAHRPDLTVGGKNEADPLPTGDTVDAEHKPNSQM